MSGFLCFIYVLFKDSYRFGREIRRALIDVKETFEKAKALSQKK
jgi:hypothetical protein